MKNWLIVIFWIILFVFISRGAVFSEEIEGEENLTGIFSYYQDVDGGGQKVLQFPGKLFPMAGKEVWYLYEDADDPNSIAHPFQFRYPLQSGKYTGEYFYNDPNLGKSTVELSFTPVLKWPEAYCYQYTDPTDKIVEAGCYQYPLISLDLPVKEEGHEQLPLIRNGGNKQAFTYYNPKENEGDPGEKLFGDEYNYKSSISSEIVPRILPWELKFEYASKELQSNGESLTKKALISSSLQYLSDPNSSHFMGKIKYSHGFGKIKEEPYQELVYTVGYGYVSQPDRMQLSFLLSYRDFTDIFKYAKPKSDLAEGGIELARKFFFGDQSFKPFVGCTYIFPVSKEDPAGSRAESGFRYEAVLLKEISLTEDLGVAYTDNTISGLKFGCKGRTQLDFFLNGDDIFFFVKADYYTPLPLSSLNEYGEISGGGGVAWKF